VVKLQDALNNSTYIVSAWKEDLLIDMARCLSDDVSIFYLQDILIHPDHQRKGLGRRLLQNCINRFEHVKTKILLTGGEEKQKTFYESLGYKNTKECTKEKLNAYVMINDVDLG
jgi:GNAT superfamily N-acetyltransferase